VEHTIEGLLSHSGQAGQPSPAPDRTGGELLYTGRTAHDIAARLQGTMDTMCSKLGYELGSTGGSTATVPSQGGGGSFAFQRPQAEVPLPARRGDVDDFTLNADTLAGLHRFASTYDGTDRQDGHEGAAHRAMGRYDANSDGALDTRELRHLLTDIVRGDWDP